jgi:hypothetical protein
MNRLLCWVFVFSCACLQAASLPGEPQAQLGNWSVRSGDGETRPIHDRLAGNSGTLIALGASASQEAGQAQQQAFLRTHQQLAEQTNDLPPIVHLSIIAGPPRLVQGFIRRGIVREYDDPVQPEAIWLLFPDDYSDYERQTGLAVGESGYWVWVNSQGHIAWSIEQQGERTATLLIERLME